MKDQTADPLDSSEHSAITRLFHMAPRCHRQIDWRSLEEWLPSQHFRCRVARLNGSIQALVGATLHDFPEQNPSRNLAWLRFILPPQRRDADPVLAVLWEALRADLKAAGVSDVALLAIEPWVSDLVSGWGFSNTGAVITLRRLWGAIPDPPPAPYVVREVRLASDFEAVMRIDAAAFDVPWRYDRATLEYARQQAATFTVLARGGDILGYQLSTQHGDAGHLARLALLPEAQGHGLGGMLAGEMLRFFWKRGVDDISVNTQEDNLRSQRLYERLDFRRTGHRVPLWELALAAG